MIHSARARKVISWLPRERVLLETDGPFAKVKGNVIYPSDVTSVTEYLTQEWQVDISEVNSQLKDNLRDLVT